MKPKACKVAKLELPVELAALDGPGTQFSNRLLDLGLGCFAYAYNTFLLFWMRLMVRCCDKISLPSWRSRRGG